MNNNWQRVKLDDVCDLIAGFAFKGKDFGEEFQSKVIKIADIQPPNVKMDSLTGIDVSKYDESKLQKYRVGIGDYVFAMTGATIGKLGRIQEGEAYINQRVLTFRNNLNVCDKDFLYYVLAQPSFLGYILNHIDSETAQPNISASSVGTFEFYLPPISTQKQIANVLRGLDDKIELNNKINRNLEAQAQAIFKSWFIDFEPFKNGKFIDSELGRIPEGWKVYRLSELCEIITKGTTPTTLKRSFKNKGINFIKAENISNNHLIDKTKLAFIDIQTHELLSRSQLKPFDILFTIAGTIGRFAIVLPDIIPANTNQAIAIIRCKDIYTLLVYSMFLCGNHLTYFNSKVVQAVQANLSLSTIGSLPMLLPPKAVVERYISIVYPLFKLTFDNSDESSHLAQLRNTLLPKLMTGKVNISDILV